MDRPNQFELDSVASFVEVAEDLAHEPFMSEDEKQKYSLGNDNFPARYWLGDRTHFRSALISFRRLWMKGEPSHHLKVKNVLRRYRMEPFTDRKHKGFEPTARLAEKNVHIPDVTSDELIDLWINTVFAHGGLQEKSPINRKRFDELVAYYGLGICEYAFRTEVQFTIIHLVSFNDLFARPALNAWIAGGLKPSFEVSSPFGRKLKEKTADGAIIIRQASSRFYTQETTERRFRRVLSRDRYRSLEFIFSQMGATDEGCVILVMQSKGILDMIESLEWDFSEMAHKDDLEWKNIPGGKGMTTVGDMKNLFTEHEPVFVDTKDKIYATRQGIEFLNEQFVHFKNAFLQTE